jgi:hypothetical protein
VRQAGDKLARRKADVGRRMKKEREYHQPRKTSRAPEAESEAARNYASVAGGS